MGTDDVALIAATLGAAASVVTAAVAIVALRGWRAQDRASREAAYLDATLDALHAFVVRLSRPVTIVQSAKIGMAAHIPVRPETTPEIAGAIAYIKSYGEQHGKMLFDALDEARDSHAHLKSLMVKGLLFGFPKYADCAKALQLVLWQLDRMDAFAATIRSPTRNFDHPEVVKAVEAALRLDRDAIDADLDTNGKAVLEFARDTYKRIYG